MKYLVRAINIYNNLFLVSRKTNRFQLQIFPTRSKQRRFAGRILETIEDWPLKSGHVRSERETSDRLTREENFRFSKGSWERRCLPLVSFQTLRGNRLDVPSDSEYVESINGGIICYKRVVGNYSEYPLITTNANNTECGAVTVDTRGSGAVNAR